MANFLTANPTVETICLALAVQRNTGSLLRYRNRGTHGLIWNRKGAKEFCFAGHPDLRLGKNELLYLPMYSDYTVRGAEQGGYVIINFRFTENAHNDPLKIAPEDPAAFTDLFQSAAAAWNSNTYRPLALLYEILCKLDKALNAAPVRADIPGWLTRARLHIEENYDRHTIRISSLAEAAGVCEAFFRRRFKAAYGEPPHRYIYRLRMRRAVELLESDAYLVKDVARLCGYKNEYYFSLDFKKYYGVAPSRYRNE